jgi:esterase/lipase
MKRIFVIPGFKESPKDKTYSDLTKILKEKNLEPFIVDIKWNYQTFNQWLKQFLDFYNENKGRENIIFGFSFGAIIALGAAAKVNPKLLLLCSMSPSFSEDIPKFKKTWLEAIGNKRVENFKKLSFEKLAKEIKCKTILTLGEKEAKKYPMQEKRILEAHKKIANNSLIRIPNTHHNIGQKEYLETIEKIKF